MQQDNTQVSSFRKLAYQLGQISALAQKGAPQWQAIPKYQPSSGLLGIVRSSPGLRLLDWGAGQLGKATSNMHLPAGKNIAQAVSPKTRVTGPGTPTATDK